MKTKKPKASKKSDSSPGVSRSKLKKFFNRKMRDAIFAKPYSFYFIFFFFLYLIFNVWIIEVHITYRVLIDNLYYGIPMVILSILVAAFVALDINLMIMKFKELKKVNKGAGGVTTIAIFLGLLGGACPGCIAGLFPVVMGIFGGTAFSLNALPFYGLELQALSLVLLVIGARLMSKPAVCKI